MIVANISEEEKIELNTALAQSALLAISEALLTVMSNLEWVRDVHVRHRDVIAVIKHQKLLMNARKLYNAIIRKTKYGNRASPSKQFSDFLEDNKHLTLSFVADNVPTYCEHEQFETLINFIIESLVNDLIKRTINIQKFTQEASTEKEILTDNEWNDIIAALIVV